MSVEMSPLPRGRHRLLFGSKEDCFMSAFEEAYGHILDAMGPPAPTVDLARRLGLG